MLTPSELREQANRFEADGINGSDLAWVAAELCQQVAELREKSESESRAVQNLSAIAMADAWDRDMESPPCDLLLEYASAASQVAAAEIDRQMTSKVPRPLKASEITEPGWYASRGVANEWDMFLSISASDILNKVYGGGEYYGPIPLPE